MATLSTNITRYNELMKNPLLFLQEIDRTEHDRNGNIIGDITWEPINTDFSGRIPRKELKGNYLGYSLVVAEKADEDSLSIASSQNGIISFSIHAVNPENLYDWCLVINSFIIRSKIQYDKFPYCHLLWMLNYTRWNSNTIVNTLNFYDIQTQPYIINQLLSKICRCLSENKQRQMQLALARFNYQYQIYVPSSLKEAISHMSSQPQYGIGNMNIFRLVDYVLETEDSSVIRIIEKDTKNNYLILYQWIKKEEYKIDYSLLSSLFAILSLSMQLKVVKRYFHDIRLGHTIFDPELLKQFKDNQYAEFIGYRYCLETPEIPMDLTVPMLCDCILTLYQTKGESFQSFDGILDFAMTHCDVSNPSISLGLENFLPQCHGGAVYNPNFRGFIDYSIVCELDESKFTEEYLLTTIKEQLNRYPHAKYHACSFDDQKRPLTKEELEHCHSKKIIYNSNNECLEESRFSCTTTCNYENKWVVTQNDVLWLNNMLNEPLHEETDKTKKHIIDINQISTQVWKNYILTLPDQYEKDGKNHFVVDSKDINNSKLLLQFSKPISLRIIPLSSPVINMRLDLFGILKSLCQEKKIFGPIIPKEVIIEFQKRESEEVQRRVIESLKQVLNLDDYNGCYFEIPYDKGILRKILKLYYYKGVMTNNQSNVDNDFLKGKYHRDFVLLCAPKLAEEFNKAINLPFFWCRGVECFKNSLNNQVLENCENWLSYSLYHMIEIIGYPKLKKTEAGIEPDSIVTSFIACVNKVMQKFRRLKCRNCGHLMYTYNYHSFNRYNYYSCINPDCPEHNRPVYLNYCYKCKKSLIDSRDSIQCPNGWYICSKCLACCDDDQYERQAQRYILENRPIPPRIERQRGLGHNDKGIFFCYHCGAQLQSIDDHGVTKLRCPQCGEIFNM